MKITAGCRVAKLTYFLTELFKTMTVRTTFLLYVTLCSVVYTNVNNHRCGDLKSDSP